MIITTAGRTNQEMKEKARRIAAELEAEYIDRNKRSVGTIQKQVQDDCIVVGKERLELFPVGENQPFFFHPNSAMFRIKRLIKGESDPFLQAARLQRGKSMLDCTLGLASDSIMASYTVGQEGEVTGLEGNRYLAFLVENGLRQWESGLESMDQSMRRIHVKSTNSFPYLEMLPDNSYDVVYFDPMFEENILESDGIKALSRFAVYADLSEEIIFHAKRVAKERVVLKDHFRSSRFKQFGFRVYKRKTSKFHFGVIEK
ncbi:class I SAM-dependent methyltransferase [Bacillus sp. ISL-47]|uniref:class I SAM-dependent methyltransferase n=1 Tax=Bacillus sp. ISL-47 TaxID=2819130 RepID=UPI001BEA0433|nr:class I SAM-dependent methyltransferase [Bacillus sp. ISL-47]MBT2690283.1 class I SAM-dependent methyltransferase [Bacillus sp. ISL-47]MBT2708953.1 class I SAM-dependent methyltransferase [Pseudomonas sp. ISL-84]